MGEFELIRRHFVRPAPPNAHVVLGIGDDAALLQPSPGQQWAISSDMLVAGRHFFPDVSPKALGHKTLAVNLSDLAAMGARPVGFTLALALPQADHAWLSAFAQGYNPGINQGEIHIGAISFGVPLGPSRAESDWNADKRQAAGKKCLELGGGDLLGKVRLGAPSGRALAILREGRMTCPCVTMQARVRISVRGT